MSVLLLLLRCWLCGPWHDVSWLQSPLLLLLLPPPLLLLLFSVLLLLAPPALRTLA
jgi:hypothetical protein